MDWYQFRFGRPSPGRRLRDHLRDDPTSEEARRVRSAGAVAVVPVAPNPPEWSRQATEARARRRRTEGSTPAVQVPAPEVPPGSPDQPQEHVPFSVASGQDDTPFGSDFAAWYEATRGRPLPSQFMEQDPVVMDQGEPAANGGPLGIEGGVVNMPIRMEHGANDHAPTVQVHLPPIRGRQWDPERQAGIRPDFDPDVEWAKAEYAAQQRWRRGQPTQADLTFAAIMGRPPGRPMTNTRRRADGAVQQGQASYGDIPELSGSYEARIDTSRPRIENGDGTFSTERTITIESDGRFFNIPTIVGGRQRSEDEAVALWRQGHNPEVGSFRTEADALTAAQRRSREIGRVRGGDR